MKRKVTLFKKSIQIVWKSAPGWTVANSIVAFSRSFLPLILVYLIKILIDSITGNTGLSVPLVNEILKALVAVVMIWFLDEAASDFGIYIRKQQSVKLESYMFGLLHKKAISLDLQCFENPAYYDSLSRAAREAPWRPNSILNNCITLLRCLISLCLMAGVLSAFHWSIVVCLIVANIPGILLKLHFSDMLYNFKREITPEARKMSYFNGLLTGNRSSREIRLFGLGNYFIEQFRKAFFNTKDEEVNIIKKRARIDLISDLFKAAIVFGMFFLIAMKTVKGEITLGEMSMYLLAFRQGMVYMKELFSSVAGLYEDSLFVGDAFDFLDLKENIKAVEPFEIIRHLSHQITVENLSFGYPNTGKNVIENVSFEIKCGEVVAIVGANGAGKSTLVKLLGRLYDPKEGSIKWDGTDIRHFSPEEYRKKISVIFQDFMLYNMSLGENIRMGDVGSALDKDRLLKAAAATGISEVVKTLPKGFDTVIGNLFDDSRELSWGEWQKTAFSRALYSDAPLLILDEPSSSLDANTEYEIFNRFRDIVKGKTSILISHRLSNVTMADKIIVLDNGTVAETGSHADLLAKGGLYKSMYERMYKCDFDNGNE